MCVKESEVLFYVFYLRAKQYAKQYSIEENKCNLGNFMEN